MSDRSGALRGANGAERDALLRTAPYRMERAFSVVGGFVRSLVDLPRPLRFDEAGISAFLRIGYVPGDRTLFEDVYCLPAASEVALASPGEDRPYRVVRRDKLVRTEIVGPHSPSELCSRAKVLLRQAVRRALSQGGSPLLPLSGGIDSRLLLGELLRELSPREIRTVTYGVPGALDFEIGNRVAAHAGTLHERVDLGDVRFTIEKMRRAAEWTDANTTVNHPVVWVDIADRLGTDHTVWSGFAGDAVGGGFSFPQGGSDAALAVAHFVEREGRPLERWWKGSMSVDHVAGMVEQNTVFDEILDRAEAVWFANHVERYTAHHVFPTPWRFVAPLMDADFVRFFFAIPRRYRAKKLLFDRLASESTPALFVHPTRDYGHRLDSRRVAPLHHLRFTTSVAIRRGAFRLAPARVTHPHTTYMNFGAAFRCRRDVHDTAEALVESLAARQILDPGFVRRTWRRHQQGEDLAYPVSLLISLEAIAQCFIDPP